MKYTIGCNILFVIISCFYSPPLCSAQGQTNLIINEFLTSNGSSLPLGQGELLDEDGESSDWIELYNPTLQSIDLTGWHLSDDPNNLSRWSFPEISIPPHQYFVVFASGKDRTDPDAILHTNFKLSRDSGDVILIKPDATTIVHSYHYPLQFRNIAYGISAVQAPETTTLIQAGAPAKAWIASNDQFDQDWKDPGFNDQNWQSGQTGVGYDYPGLINLDTASMRYQHTSVYVRIDFEVPNVTTISQLILRMKYEDGFVAYLNGIPVASANAPALEQLRWNSTATTQNDDSAAVVFEDFQLPQESVEALVEGRNVLAIHGLNVSNSSSDLLILPELVAQSFKPIDINDATEGYLSIPTPQAPNGEVLSQVGPVITDTQHWPVTPQADEDLIISARVEATEDLVLHVLAIPVINFGDPMPALPAGWISLFDDGTGADSQAEDGIYTGTLPAALYEPGDMVRWQIHAYDMRTNVTRSPLQFPNLITAHYHGTIVQDPAIQSQLPIMQWYVEDVGASERDSGTRGSLFFLDEFYDNIIIHRRGGSTAGAIKKHFKFNFNPGHKFRYDPNESRVNEFNLNSPYSDKAYLRQNLAFEAYDWCGCPGSISFPVVAYRNGDFFGVQIFIEEPEEELLDREGLDPDGALYKMYNTFTSSGGAEKKTRRWEGRNDLSYFINSINNTSGITQHQHIFDQVDLPRTLNYLVATVLVHQNDHPHKNHYLYRDSDGSGQWFFMPWDHDLTWGSNWTGSSYHDYIYAADDQVPGKPQRVKPSHPFVGMQDCQEWNYHWNHLTDALLNNSTVREMFLRRLRTVMDQYLKVPGTPPEELFIEQRIDQLVAQMAPDVATDYLKWANPWKWGGQGSYNRNQSFAEAIDILKQDYLAVRREHLFVTHHVDNADSYPITGSYSARIPHAQPNAPEIRFGSIVFNPLSTNQDEEYIELINPNSFAVDLTGWHVAGGIEHEFIPGTVIPSGSHLYLSPNSRDFLNRSLSPTAGEGHLVQGNYKGHLSNWGETLELINNDGVTINTVTYEGAPTDQQQFFRISQLMYHPPLSDQPEYLGFVNIGPESLNLAGMQITAGIRYVFPEMALAPGQTVFLTNDPDGLAEQTERVAGALILGPYEGQLSNAGEEVKIEDATNSTILAFKYKDSWYPSTDGRGQVLVVTDPVTTPINGLSQKKNWQAAP